MLLKSLNSSSYACILFQSHTYVPSACEESVLKGSQMSHFLTSVTLISKCKRKWDTWSHSSHILLPLKKFWILLHTIFFRIIDTLNKLCTPLKKKKVYKRKKGFPYKWLIYIYLLLELTSQKLPFGTRTKGFHLLYLFRPLIHKFSHLREWGHGIEEIHRIQPRSTVVSRTWSYYHSHCWYTWHTQPQNSLEKTHSGPRFYLLHKHLIITGWFKSRSFSD